MNQFFVSVLTDPYSRLFYEIIAGQLLSLLLRYPCDCLRFLRLFTRGYLLSRTLEEFERIFVVAAGSWLDSYKSIEERRVIEVFTSCIFIIHWIHACEMLRGICERCLPDIEIRKNEKRVRLENAHSPSMWRDSEIFLALQWTNCAIVKSKLVRIHKSCIQATTVSRKTVVHRNKFWWILIFWVYIVITQDALLHDILITSIRVSIHV